MGNNRSNVSLGLFSVLIANYNNGQYLKEAIQSVYNQTYTNWEIVIVDDGSTDCSREIYQKIQSDSRIHIYFNEKNEGCGYTKRKCVELAHGELCGFLDPDDLILPHALEIMVHNHHANIEASIVSSTYTMYDVDLKCALYEHHPPILPSNMDYLHYNNASITAFSSFKKELYNKTLGIDASFRRAVDQDLYYKLEEVGKLVQISQSLYVYRIHKDSISLNDNEYKALYWHIMAIHNACYRRGIIGDAEDIVSALLCGVSMKNRLVMLQNKLNHPSIGFVLRLFLRWIKKILTWKR